jgi:small GTP-binding protein
MSWGKTLARLGWLHLSDLHLGPHGSRLLQPEYREALEQDLRRLHAQSGPWHVVFISGDLTLSGDSKEFALLNSTLSSLWDYLRGLGSDPCLLAVPGNHDLSGPSNMGTRHRALEVRKAFQGTKRGSSANTYLTQSVRRGFRSFSNWFEPWREVGGTCLLENFREGLLPGDFVTTLITQDLKVGVVGLNSTFRSSSRDEPEELCEIDVEQIDQAAGGDLREWGLQHDFVVLLTHHSPSKLRSRSLVELEEKLTGPGRPLLHLCGSRHAEGSRTVGYPSSRRSLAIHAPSLFSEREGVPAEEGRWGYIAGELRTPIMGGQLKLFPRIAASRKGLIILGPDREALPGYDGVVEIPMTELLAPGPDEALEAFSSLGSLPLAMAAPAPRANSLPRLPPQEQPLPPAALAPGVKRLFALDTGQEQVGWLAWAPSGDALGLGLFTGHVVCWKPGEVTPRWTIKAHETEVVDLCFSPDGQVLASRSRYHIRLWRMDGTQLETPQPLMAPGNELAWSSRGQFVTDYGPGGLQFWNTETWREFEGVRRFSTSVTANALAWSPDGQLLACGGEGAPHGFLLLHAETEGNHLSLSPRPSPSMEADILDIAWDPTSRWVALARKDKTILIWDTVKSEAVTLLEGHTHAVMSLAVSFDGQLLASRSLSGSVRLFRTDTWEQVARIDEPAEHWSMAGLAFSPTKHVLAASVGPRGHAVQLWELDLPTLLGAQAPSATVHEVSAKVVLVGEGRVGKSCLALRMVKDQYEELDSTHGMRFWSMPTESLAPDATADRLRRELILWDLGGQSEYQLVHQLFLRDSTAALMVLEPGRGERALEEIEGWNRRLVAQAGDRDIRKILVGAKVDTSESPENRPALEGLVRRLGFDSYVSTSAKTGQGVPELKAALERVIDWDSIEKVSRPELFQRMRQLIQRMREEKRVVISFSELEVRLHRELGSTFDPEALRTVVGHLARQGLVADTRMAGGTRVLILEVEQLERYAGSLIVAARDNPHGVPAIEVSKVLSPRMKFPRIKEGERLREDQELPVLNCVIELLIEHGLCLRHEGLLIFPSLFQPTHAESSTDFSHTISLQYDFFGPIDNIYASLVTSLAVSQQFGPMRLWENRAEFGQAGKDASGVRRVQSRSQGARGFAQLDVYFDEGTDPKTRELFVSFIERHLREHGVELRERLAVTCACGKVFSEETVRRRLAEGRTDIGCESCDRRTPLTLSKPELEQQIQVLRTRIQEKRQQAVSGVKATMSEEPNVRQAQDTPLRILHLSDLHVGAKDDPISLRHPLVADLRDKHEGLGIERLDYLIISGDLTHRASPEEFEKAYEFVSGLIDEFGLTAQRCIIVPGNHDLDWKTPAYKWENKREVEKHRLTPGAYVDAGPGYLLRDEAKYPERFKNFSEHFYHRLTQKPYPLPAEEQCIPFLFSDDGLQFLAMNSAWNIDEYFQERSSISDKALARGLVIADQELASARAEGKLAKDSRVLRIAVWHHPITGNEKIQADAFLGQLRKAEVRLCLHGHVHEERTELLNHLDPKRMLHVIGGGSFGAPSHDRPESVPRLYNLLEVKPNLQQVHVHTRSQRKQGGAWEGWAVWPAGSPGSRRSFYELTLTY